MAARSVQRIKAEREFLRHLESPVAEEHVFDPAARVRENIQNFKRYLADNVEAKPSSRRRPQTAHLARHRRIWSEAELQSACTKRGRNTGTWKACARDIDEFSRHHLEQSSAEGHRGNAKASKVAPQAAVAADAILLRYILAYQSLRKACRELPKLTVEGVHQCLTGGEGWDVGGKGNPELRVVRRKVFDVRVEKLGVPPRAAAALYTAMDVFCDGCAAHRPFLAALRCINAPTPHHWLSFVLTVLASHNSALHIAEFLSAERWLLDDIIAEGLKSREHDSVHYLPKWQLRSDECVVEFLRLRDSIFVNGVQTTSWKDIRPCILEKFPALTEIVIHNKL